jgi:DNA-binding transcriptional LysR family regulator
MAAAAVVNLRAIDLNLLVALDALLTERHVSRAAFRIGLSQPAMSNALLRIRTLFRDDILVRTPHGMEPTPRALELAGTVRSVLRQVERTFERESDFDPGSSALLFRLRMSDVIGFLFLPGMIAALEKAAPSIALEISHLPPSETLDALDGDRIDLAVSMGLQHGGAIKELPILEDRMMCLVRDGHPLQSKNDLDAFLAHRHLRIAMSPTDSRFVDNILASLGRSRDVAINIPHWLLAPTLVRVSNLVAVMPGRLAQSVMRETGGLAIVKLPFATESFDWTIYWHRRHDKRAAHIWFRELIATVAKGGAFASSDRKRTRIVR